MGKSQDAVALIVTTATATHLVVDMPAIPQNTMPTKNTAGKLKLTENVSIKGQICHEYHPLLVIETNATAMKGAIQADPPVPITILERGRTFTARPLATQKASSIMTMKLPPGT